MTMMTVKIIMDMRNSQIGHVEDEDTSLDTTDHVDMLHVKTEQRTAKKVPNKVAEVVQDVVLDEEVREVVVVEVDQREAAEVVTQIEQGNKVTRNSWKNTWGIYSWTTGQQL
jgi:hypothetical protein